MLDILYKPYAQELVAFGTAWCGPETYESWKETLIARYPGEGDGQTVEVYCTAAPARFYRLNVLEGPNSVGEIKPPYSVSTGSGQASLAAQIAKSISEGMLGFDPTSSAELSGVKS